MNKFGVYHGKDQAFRKRYASGGDVTAGTYKLTPVDDSSSNSIATSGTFSSPAAKSTTATETPTNSSPATAPVSTTPATTPTTGFSVSTPDVNNSAQDEPTGTHSIGTDKYW